MNLPSNIQRTHRAGGTVVCAATVVGVLLLAAGCQGATSGGGGGSGNDGNGGGGGGDAVSCADFSADFTLSPPTWIHGTWSFNADSLGVELYSGTADELKVTFTAGRLIFLILLDGTNLVAHEDRQIDVSVTEENSTSTEYSFVVPPGNGVESVRWVFTRTSSSSIEWAISGLSDPEVRNRFPLIRIDSC